MNAVAKSEEIRSFDSPEKPLVRPYAAELAELYHSIADRLEFYAKADPPNHLNRKVYLAVDPAKQHRQKAVFFNTTAFKIVPISAPLETPTWLGDEERIAWGLMALT